MKSYQTTSFRPAHNRSRIAQRNCHRPETDVHGRSHLELFREQLAERRRRRFEFPGFGPIMWTLQLLKRASGKSHSIIPTALETASPYSIYQLSILNTSM